MPMKGSSASSRTHRPRQGSSTRPPICSAWNARPSGGMQEGSRRTAADPELVRAKIGLEAGVKHPELNEAQQAAVQQIFESREQIVGLDGVAGAGKTTTLTVVREGAEGEGYKVEGFAPTSRAAQQLSGAGIKTSTLQMHLAKGQQPDHGEKRLYVLDESSLASTKQMHDFVTRLHPNDRVLLVGDTRQHEAVEAGRPFAQLQEAGMKTVKLEEIVRQKDPELKNVVEQLAQGKVEYARVKHVDGAQNLLTVVRADGSERPTIHSASRECPSTGTRRRLSP